MLSSNGNPYLRPEYLNPPPATMDSKKSPLALLAQTCSQIGSDSPAVPSINTKNTEKKKDPKASPVSGCSSADSSKDTKKKPESPAADKRAPTPDKRAKSSSPKETPGAALMNDAYKSLMSAGLGTPFPFPYPGMLPPGFAPGLPAGLGSGYPGLDAYAIAKAAMPPPMMNSYLNPAYLAALQYGRKSDCRDPYCTGCPPSVQMVCVAGCALSAQCDHPKVPIPSHLSSQPATSPSGAPAKPYVCNWIVADNYCGKRFATSDDLLQHLRTHTNAAAQQSADLNHHLLSQSFGPAALRAYPTPPLSPLSAARYHPYGKTPGAGTSQQQPSPAQPSFPLMHPMYPGAAPSGGNPGGLFPHPALAPYYSHLSLFGPRPLGSAPLPP